MPSAYQIFKNDVFQTVKSTYFNDYTLKNGENILTLVTAKCKEEWANLSNIQKKIYIEKSEKIKSKPRIDTKLNDDGEINLDTIEKNTEESSPNVFEVIDNSNNEKKKNQESPPTYEESLENTISDKEIKELPDSPTSSILPNSSNITNKNKTKKRKSIPKAVKESVWKKYVSKNELEGSCFIGCGNAIQINNFELGHVVAVANGGKDTITNLRPICSLCNKSMGTTNLDDFISTFGFKENNSFDEEINVNNKELNSISKQISKNKKHIIKLNNTKSILTAEIDEFQKMIEELTLKIKLKQGELEKNESTIHDIEITLQKNKEQKELLESKNSELLNKKQEFVKSTLIEEEKLKQELRKEILYEQKKNALKKQMMEEMGIN